MPIKEQFVLPERTMIAISVPLAARINVLAAEAAIAGGGRTRISQRVVSDILLRGMLEQLGDGAGQYVIDRLPLHEENGWNEV